MTMKLSHTMFQVLEISKTNKYSKFELFPCKHDDFKMVVFLLYLLNIRQLLHEVE